MKYYSTSGTVEPESLKNVVLRGLAPDKGLFMPEKFPVLEESFYENLKSLSLPEIGFEVSKALFGEDVETTKLKELVYDALNFDIPLVNVHDNIFSLELYHGPTLAFKDVGARFMARMLGLLTEKNDETTNVLVATSGDTGSAVANGFYNVPGIRVYVLYPKGLVSEIQEKQFTTLGGNITALEVEGNFDDCQRLVKEAFMDNELRNNMILTSANSINLARLLPQSFYYFYAIGQLPAKFKNVCVSVPSGNFGNLSSGLIAKKMGLNIDRFIAATNVNHIVPDYLLSGNYEPKPSVATIANAMDVGAPSNFDRMLDLYGNNRNAMSQDIVGYWYPDSEIKKEIKHVYTKYGYVLDPHGAIGYKAISDFLKNNATQAGIFLETAHPAKFKDVVEEVLEDKIEIPEKLMAFMKKEKVSEGISKEYSDLKSFLISRQSL